MELPIYLRNWKATKETPSNYINTDLQHKRINYSKTLVAKETKKGAQNPLFK